MLLSIFKNGVDCRVIQPVAHDCGKVVPVPQVPAAVLRANQESTSGVRQQGCHHIARKSVGGCVIADLAAVQPREPRQRRHPQIALGIAHHRAHQIAAQPVGLGISLQMWSGAWTAAPMCQAVPRADPQCSVRIHRQRADKVVGQSIGRRERGNAAAMNPIEPVRSPNPQSPLGAVAKERITSLSSPSRTE